ncbi:MAG: hypothetical protein ACE5K4_10090 [Candidatus Hydrothermarchaeota archaeon]
MKKFYRLFLVFKTPILTPLQADTIFGHLCWVIAHKEGENGLKKFLDPFKRSNPPFIISDGFPHELLPKPLSAEFLCPEEKRKEVKKREWINIEEFNKVRKAMLFEFPADLESRDIPQNILSIHNTIDRITNTVTSEVGVYSFHETAISKVCIYLKIIEDVRWLERIRELFEELSKIGFGRKKSIGKGHFSIEDIEIFNGFSEIENADGFVTLSNFCPAENDPVDGLYKTFVKYGKLGEEFTFCGNPFKRPLLMIKTGSVFKTKRKPEEFYGRMINERISPQIDKVVQYAYAFPVPLSYPKEI